MKTIISLKDSRKVRNQEFKRIRKLDVTCVNSPWITCTRPDDGSFWEEDASIKQSGLEQTQIRKIRGIPSIIKIKHLNQNSLTHLQGIRGINKCLSYSHLAMKGTYLYVDINHRLSDNPCNSLYGTEWENELKASTTLRPYFAISDIILFMCQQLSAMMRGTIHKDLWYFYHDALSYITTSETMEWMRNTTFEGKDIHDR